MGATEASARAIIRIVLIVVGVVLCLYLIYLIRRPLSWIFIALFIAVALSGPVNWLDRRMRRGFAIAIVFFGLFTVPVLLGAVVLPPLVTEVNDFAHNVPQYADDVQEFVRDNETLQELDEDYKITQKLEEEAGKLPAEIGGAATILGDVGIGILNSLFAGFTILILAAFMLGSGRMWVDRFVELQPSHRRERLRRILRESADAVAGYVAGALGVATIAGTLAFAVLTILGVPFAPALALLVGVFSLIPLIGATIAAVLVGIVTLFNDFPTATIIWTVWAVVYQQVENTLIQPQIHRRTVDVHPFVVLVAVLIGAQLIGVLGAIVAIPAAATIQIGLREYRAWVREVNEEPPEDEPPAEPPPAKGAEPPPEPAPA